MLPAGRDDEVGGQGRGRQGRGPGVLRHDDGAHEEAPRRQEQRSQVKQDGGKKDISLTAKTENKIRVLNIYCLHSVHSFLRTLHSVHLDSNDFMKHFFTKL